MVERFASGRSEDDWARHGQGAVRLADRHAVVPRTWPGLWEARSSLPSGREARVLFADGMLIALHALIKKTRQTPAEDLAISRQRLKEATS